MGSTLSKSEACMHMVWCGGGDDAYPDPSEMANPLAEDLELSQEVTCTLVYVCTGTSQA